MKAAVISGGGSWGAFTTGYLSETQPHYSCVIGTSTGALMAPFVALREYGKLDRAYRNQSNKNVWDFRPVKRNGKLRPLAYARFALASRTFGKSEQLLSTIRRIYPQDLHQLLRLSNNRAMVCVYDLSAHERKYILLNQIEWEEATFWMYASACAPLLMSLAKRDGRYYSDGGLSDLIPIDEAVRITNVLTNPNKSNQVTIDVFIHRVDPLTQPYYSNSVVSNFDNIKDTLEALSKSVGRHNLRIGELTAQSKGIKLNKIYLPKTPEFSSMWFSKEDMTKLSEYGKEISIKTVSSK